MKQSYEEYRFSMTEILKYLVQGLLLCGAVDYLFYQNPWLMFLALPVTVFFLKCAECCRSGRIFCRKCSYGMFQRLGTAVSAGNRYCAGISLYGNTAEGKCAGGRAFYEFR